MTTEVVVRKWGSSLGVILPKELVEKERLKENKKILINVIKESNLVSLFGSLERGSSGQKFKDMAREGWSA